MSQPIDKKQIQNTQQKQQNLIQLALRTCNLAEVKKAVEQEKEKINEKDDKLGWVPLYKAVLYGDEQIVEYLLNNGADPNIKNKLGDTPIHLCIENNYQEIFKILLKHKADPNIKGPDGMSPLHFACFSQKLEFISILLSYGADVDIKMTNGITPLHIAAELNSIQIIKMLLEKNPQINIKDKEGKTAVEFCTDKKCKEILEEYESNCMNPLNESIISCNDYNSENLSHLQSFNNIINPEQIQNKLNPIKITQNQNKNMISLNQQNNNTNNKQVIDNESSQSKQNNNKILLEQSNASNNMNSSTRSTQSINTTQLRQNWDLKIQGLKHSIKQVKDLKQEVTKTLENHNDNQIQRNNVISQLKQQDQIEQELQSQQSKYKQFSSNEQDDKENCSSIVNFIAEQPYNQNNNKNNNMNNIQIIENDKKQQKFFSSNYELPSLEVSQEVKKYSEKIQNDNDDNQQQKNTTNQLQIKENKTISKWLREIHLECLLQNFLDNNVFDNQSLLKFLINSNDWDKLLITLFGVDKFGYRLRIITKIQEDCGVEKRNGIFALKYNLGGIQLPSIEIWLQSLQLEQYIDLFILTGFDDLESMMFQMTTDNPINDDILFKEIGICDHNARKIILDSLNRDAQNAQMVAVPKNFCGGFNFETSGQHNIKQCDNKCTIF